MELTPAHMRLYLVTDRSLCERYGLINTVTAAVKGGVTMVQLRDKHASTKERIDQAIAIKTVLQGSGVPFVINDDLEAALAADVDGVHIGQSDGDPTAVRSQLGPDKILGLSCESEADVLAADPKVVNYLGIGTVFATGTKTDHKPAIGVNGLARIAALTHLPTVAIGGLKAEHTEAVLSADADGLAVVSAICGQDNPEIAARAFFGDAK